MEQLRLAEQQLPDGQQVDTIQAYHATYGLYFSPAELRARRGLPPILELCSLAYEFSEQLRTSIRKWERELRVVLFAGDRHHLGGKTSVLGYSGGGAKTMELLSKFCSSLGLTPTGGGVHLWENNVFPVLRRAAGHTIGYHKTLIIGGHHVQAVPQSASAIPGLQLRHAFITGRDKPGNLSWSAGYPESEAPGPGWLPSQAVPFQDALEEDSGVEDDDRTTLKPPGEPDPGQPHPAPSSPVVEDWFAEQRPRTICKVILTPDLSQPRTVLPLLQFGDLYEYFMLIRGETYHFTDGRGDLWLCICLAPEDCKACFSARWTMQWEVAGPHAVRLDLLFHDRPGDPLVLPLTFRMEHPDQAYEAVRLVEQPTVPVCLFTRHDDKLIFWGGHRVNIPHPIRKQLAAAFRTAMQGIIFDSLVGPGRLAGD